jgi:hypothetical protein
MREIRPAEAWSLLRKWEEDRTVLNCILDFPGLHLVMRGRLEPLSSNRIELGSDDRSCLFGIDIPPNAKFVLVGPLPEMRDLPPNETFDLALDIYLPTSRAEEFKIGLIAHKTN